MAGFADPTFVRRRETGSNQSIGSLVAAAKREDTDSRYGDEGFAPPYPGPQRAESPRRSLFDQQSQFGGSFAGALNQHQFGTQGSLYDAGGQRESMASGYFQRSGSSLALQDMGRPASTAFTSSRELLPRGQLPDDAQIVSDVQASTCLCASTLYQNCH